MFLGALTSLPDTNPQFKQRKISLEPTWSFVLKHKLQVLVVPLSFLGIRTVVALSSALDISRRLNEA